MSTSLTSTLFRTWTEVPSLQQVCHCLDLVFNLFIVHARVCLQDKLFQPLVAFCKHLTIFAWSVVVFNVILDSRWLQLKVKYLWSRTFLSASVVFVADVIFPAMMIGGIFVGCVVCVFVVPVSELGGSIF